MNVRLLQHTPNPDQFCAMIARYTRVPSWWDNLIPPKDGWDEFLRRIIKVGHTSVLEHAVFTFEITGVSRVMTHQLVRHRIASYAQKSHRVLPVTNVIVPPSMKEFCGDEMEKLVPEPLQYYKRATATGASREDARYFAPAGAETAIIVTMNARELLEIFFPERLAKDAQWEIRAVAYKMYELVRVVAPVIFETIKVL